MKKIFEIFTMVALLIWGSIFIYFYFSGRIEPYLTPTFRIFVPIAGTGMIILGAFNLIMINRHTGVCVHDHAGGDDVEHDHSQCDHHHDHDHSGEEEHHHHEESTASSLAFALIVLLAPILTAAKFSPDRYSVEYTNKWAQIEDDMRKLQQKKNRERTEKLVENGENPYADPNGTKGEGEDDGWEKFSLDDLKKMVPQTSAGDFLLDVPQIFYTAGDEELMAVMEGISIQTEAQVIDDTMDGSPDNRLRAYRLMIECCAADARPLSIPIDFAESIPEYKEMGWYQLIGRLHFHKGEDHEYTPILQIKQFQEMPEPEDWMTQF